MRWGWMCSVRHRCGRSACGLMLGTLCWVCGCTRSERVDHPPANVLIHNPGGGSKVAEPHPKDRGAAEVSSEGPDRHGTVLPLACLASLRVVDYLADLNSYAEMYDSDRSRTIEPARVLPAIATSGLTLVDVNHAIEGNYGHAEVEEQLRGRTGPVFGRLTHLGHVYSLPSQYSKSSCLIANQKLTIEISSWYRLMFVREGDNYRLSRVEYLEIEGG